MHSHNHNHNQNHNHSHGHSHSHDHREGGRNITFFDLLRMPTRVVLINEMLTLSIPLQFCLMNVPLFSTFYRMYKQMSQQIFSIPSNGMAMINHAASGLPRLIRQIIGGYGIVFLVFIYYVHQHVVKQVVPNLKFKNDQAADNLFYMMLVMILSYALCYFSKPGSIEHNWTKQEMTQLQEFRPEFTTERCLCFICQRPKVARSVHCEKCGYCIARLTEHNNTINICIGAKNYLQYLVFIFATTVYVFYALYLLFQSHNKEYKSGFFQLVMTIGLLYLLKNYFLKSIQHINLICHNMTAMEIRNWQRLPYLWQSTQREFLNYFSHGLIGNIIELFVPYIQGEITHEQRKQYQKLNQDEESDNAGQELALNTDGHELYKGKYVNWLNAKYYTVMDIPGPHPIKEMAYQELVKRGVLDMSQAKDDKQKKKIWQDYMKNQIIEGKKKKEMHKQQMEQMKAYFSNPNQQQGQHVHGPNCNHGHDQMSQPNQPGLRTEVPNVDPSTMNQDQMDQFRQQSQNEMKEMMKQRMEQMQHLNKGMKMEKQEEEQGGLLQGNDQDD